MYISASNISGQRCVSVKAIMAGSSSFASSDRKGTFVWFDFGQRPCILPSRSCSSGYLLHLSRESQCLARLGVVGFEERPVFAQ